TLTRRPQCTMPPPIWMRPGAATTRSFFFFQAADGIRDKLVTEFRRVLFPTPAYNLELIDMAAPGVPIGAASGVAQPPVSLSRTDGQAPLAGAEYAMRVRGV